jgi:hypothetical protein
MGAVFSAGDLTGAGSTTLPIIGLYSGADKTGTLLEAGLTNTSSSTAVALFLTRVTSAGTWTGLTEAEHTEGVVANCTAVKDATGTAPTLGDDLGYRAVLPAGGTVIWTFRGIETFAGVANGIAVLVENGTGQTCQAYIVWEE